MKKGRLRCSTIKFPTNQKFSRTWSAKTWENPPSLLYYGSSVYSNGENIFYLYDRSGGDDGSEMNKYSVLRENTWENLPVDGHTEGMNGGKYVWTDGVNIYYSNNNDNRILNGDVWEKIDGFPSLWGDNIWSDGINIYSCMGRSFHKFIDGIWEPYTWDNDDIVLYGSGIWSDGVNIYHTYSRNTQVLNGNMWETKTWDGFSPRNGEDIWSDGQRIYCSYATSKEQYVLENGVWVANTWEGQIKFGPYDTFDGDEVWSDGTNIYLNFKYVLDPVPVPQLNPAALMQGYMVGQAVRRNRT